MESNATASVIGFVAGGAFLLVALFSTLSKVTLVLFNPCLLRQVRYQDKPRTFTAVVLLYWLFGILGVAAAIASLAGVFR
jgi:hypothetical protein